MFRIFKEQMRKTLALPLHLNSGDSVQWTFRLNSDSILLEKVVEAKQVMSVKGPTFNEHRSYAGIALKWWRQRNRRG